MDSITSLFPVQAKVIEMNLEHRSVRLIDNCSAQWNKEGLLLSDGNIYAKILLPNVKYLMQPMDQGVY